MSGRNSGAPSVAPDAPTFKLEVDGQELSEIMHGDVQTLKVVMDLQQMGSFEIEINNPWDAAESMYRYIDDDTFDLGKEVKVKMGYVDKQWSMIKGAITSVAPVFRADRRKFITVAGLDALFCARDRDPLEGEAKQFQEMSDAEIVQQIAQRAGMKIKTDDKGPKHDFVVQKYQDDAAFMKERAKRLDLDLFVRTDPDSGEDELQFTEPTDGRKGSICVWVFEWGEDLQFFRPRVSMAQQISKVTVRGWDPKIKELITYTADKNDLPSGIGSGTSGPKVVEKCLSASGGKEEFVVDAPVTSAEEARELAISVLRERAYRYLTCTGVCLGKPEMRPGDNAEIRGIGKRFGGQYYLERVEHIIGTEGYRTEFQGRRVFEDGGEG